MHQRYRVRSARTPLVEFSVLRKRSYVCGVVFVLVFFASIVGFSLTMGLFLQIGLTIMAIGTLVLYWSLHAVQGTVGALALIPGLAVFGIGMGMIFVPLFSIIMGEVGEHEVGSASGLLESSQQLGASLGVAILATLFFSTLSLEKGGPQAAMAAGRQLLAAERTRLMTFLLIVVAFAIGWLLPRRPREVH